MVISSVQPMFSDWCNPKIFYVVVNVRVSSGAFFANSHEPPGLPFAFSGEIAECNYAGGEYQYRVKYRFWNKLFARWFYNRMNRKSRC